MREGGRYDVTDVDERPGTSGCVVVLTSDRLALQFVTDRGQLFLDVGPSQPTTATRAELAELRRIRSREMFG